jgi:cell division protein FtsB
MVQPQMNSENDFSRLRSLFKEGGRLSRVIGCAYVTIACAMALEVPQLRVSPFWQLFYLLLAVGLFVSLDFNWELEGEPHKNNGELGANEPSFVKSPLEAKREQEARQASIVKDGKRRQRRLLKAEIGLLLGIATILGGGGYVNATLVDRSTARTALIKAQSQAREARQSEQAAKANAEKLQTQLDLIKRGQMAPPLPVPGSVANGDAEKKLKDCLACLQMKKPEGGTGKSGEAAAQVSPDVQALVKALKEHDWGVPWSLVLLGVVALIAVAYVGKKHSEAVPVAGAAALAADVIKNADRYAKLGDKMYWWVLGGYLGVSVTLTVLFCIAIWKSFKRGSDDAAAAMLMMGETTGGSGEQKEGGDKKNGKEVDEDKKGKEEEKKRGFLSSASSLGYSVLVLLWAFAMTSYRASSKIEAPKNEVKSLGPLPLRPVRRYVKGFAVLEPKDKDASRTFGDELVGRHLKPEDLLLLLGSTDCTPFRRGEDGSNPDLAEKRAKALTEVLRERPDLKELNIQPMWLDQHERCRESADLRAVYPFLIRREP